MTHPAWTALAVDAIRRLHSLDAEQAAQLEGAAGSDTLDWLDDPDSGKGMSLARTLAASPAAMPLPFDEQREIAMAGGDPWAVVRENAAKPVPLRLPADRLLLVLRLCASFGSAAALAAMTRPPAITVVEHGAVREEVIREMLDETLLPRGIQCSLGWEHRDDDPAALCVLVLNVRDGYTYTRSRLDRDLERLLSLRRGILILVPDMEDLPADLRALLPKPLSLQEVNREILTVLLRLTHPTARESDTVALRNRFPDDKAWPPSAFPRS